MFPRRKKTEISNSDCSERQRFRRKAETAAAESAACAGEVAGNEMAERQNRA